MERAIAATIRAWERNIRSPRTPDATRRESYRDLLDAYAKEHDPSVRQAMLDALGRVHSPLAAGVARRYAGSAPFDELLEAAYRGLSNALLRFDPAYSAHAFYTYAEQTIGGEVLRYFRDRRPVVDGIEGTRRRMYGRVLKAHDLLVVGLGGREPTVAEIATHLDESEEAVLLALEAGWAVSQIVSFEEVNNGPSAQGDWDCIGSLDPRFAHVELRADLSEAMAVLPRRQQRIVALIHWGGFTQSLVAAELGISQMHVSRLYARALRTMHTHLTNK